MKSEEPKYQFLLEELEQPVFSCLSDEIRAIVKEKILKYHDLESSAQDIEYEIALMMRNARKTIALHVRENDVGRQSTPKI